MAYIIGTKVNMTQIFDDQGNALAATAILAKPVVVTQVKTVEKDGYSAVQIGAFDKKDKNSSKAEVGHVKLAKEKNPSMLTPRVLQEFSVPGEMPTVGDVLDISKFSEGDKVKVVGTSKSKGFASVIKRHNFKGQPRSHGQKHSEKAPGSLGMAGVQRVFKGKRMAGRTGGDRVQVLNLRVLKIDTDTNTIYVSGAVPGRRGTVVAVETK